MPTSYTPDRVTKTLEMCRLSTDGTEEEQRERLADYQESEFKEYLGAWEVRTGRPWTSMTNIEAAELAKKHPELMRNPGLLSRLELH